MSEKLTVGQEVRLVRTNRWTSDPPEVIGSGQVISVGRRYACAEVEGMRSYEFDMTTGYERGDVNGNGLRVLPAAQVESDKRRTAAVAILSEHRVELRPGCSITTEQVEAIAAILRPEPESERDR